MIDLEAVISLRAVDSYGSVVAAAQALGYTPSAVSQQVKRLERQLGVDLLERVGRGVVLTDQARTLLVSATRVLGDVERIEADLRAASGVVSGTLRLAAFSTATRGLIAPVVASLHVAYPELQIRLLESEPWDAVDLVASGQRDLGVVHRWGGVPLAVPDHLTVSLIMTDTADVIVRADHPLATREFVTPAHLAQAEWIATPEGTICRQWLMRMYDGVGHPPRITHQSMEFDNHLALVRAGLGVALVPRLGRSELGPDLVALACREPVSQRQVLAVYRSTMSSSPALQTVLLALREAAEAVGGGIVGGGTDGGGTAADAVVAKQGAR